MSQSPDQLSDSAIIEVGCYFVRERNALLTRARFSDLFTDHYLHLMENQIRHEPENDQLLKDALVAITLHVASRPRNETAAWTLNFREPAMNLFATGSSKSGGVTACLTTENVKTGDENVFYSQVVRDQEPTRQSSVAFEGRDVFKAVESYYQQSEQRPAAFYHLAAEEVAMVSAQPDCDLEWFAGLDDERMKDVERQETLSLLETRRYRYHCGCSLDRIYPIIAGMSAETLDDIFNGGETADTKCPRCGARYRMTREGLEAFIRSQPK